MSHLYREKSTAVYKFKDYDADEVKRLMQKTCTVYVGNLSFYTDEEQIWELFSKVLEMYHILKLQCGEVKRITMGLNWTTRTPCGFCFVEYYTRESARDAVKWLNNTKLDERDIRVDWDVGIGLEKRKYGRGKGGGQVRDDYRTNYDPGRGGYGLLAEFTSDSATTGDATGTTDGADFSTATAKRPREEEPAEQEDSKRQKT